MVAAPRPNAANRGGVQTVGEAPSEQRSIDVAVLADQGGVITQAGRLTLEGDLEYARADRNRVLFRGVAIPEAVLIGAFDINESRQDVVTVAAVARFGISNRLEINGRLPLVYRADNSALAPVVNNGGNTNVGTDRTVSSSNLGDVDFGIRYQLTGSKDGWPYLIIGAQAVAPSGTDPFAVPRDGLGNPLSAATGAGFWGVTPTLTAILPSDPPCYSGRWAHVQFLSPYRPQDRIGDRRARVPRRAADNQLGHCDRAESAGLAEPRLCAHAGARHQNPVAYHQPPEPSDQRANVGADAQSPARTASVRRKLSRERAYNHQLEHRVRRD
jgi:hypothetical protein